ncbi:MAG: hypothetical protein PHV48_00860 [Candidatus Omnitrophica bacterium]|nr:hypothetical protein [Candidatus Omnitrophota bacterium]
MRVKPLTDKSYRSIVKSYFQKDFSCVKEEIAVVLEHEPDRDKLFSIILCEHFNEIRRCEEPGLKITALKNVLMALDYLGKMSQVQRWSRKK